MSNDIWRTADEALYEANVRSDWPTRGRVVLGMAQCIGAAAMLATALVLVTGLVVFIPAGALWDVLGWPGVVILALVCLVLALAWVAATADRAVGIFTDAVKTIRTLADDDA